jgi:hypothetical protein
MIDDKTAGQRIKDGALVAIQEVRVCCREEGAVMQIGLVMADADGPFGVHTFESLADAREFGQRLVSKAEELMQQRVN